MIHWLRRSSAGFTFIELVVATGVMMVLASAAIPLARVSIRRQKEAELHRDLREMRAAIDRFKDMADAGQISATQLQFGCENYPSSLQQLVDGVTRANDASGHVVRFLRRVPIDPMTNSTDWGLRAYADAPDSTTWSGSCVYDVYTKMDGKGLDGTKFRDW
jgi:general secretion pathway protein G